MGLSVTSGKKREYDSSMTTMRARIDLELAGRDPDLWLTWRGQHPVRVEIDGDSVRWDYLYREGPFGPGEPEAGFGFPELPVAPPFAEGRLALVEFLRLADGSPEMVRRFVERWGPLNLCRHRLPATHWPLADETAPRDGPRCPDVDGDATHGQEPIDVIRSWAAVAHAPLRIGLALAEDGALGNEEDWRTLAPRSEPPTTHDAARQRLSGILNIWLALGLVWVQVDLLDKPRMRPTAFGSFGVVARELAIAVLNASVALCVACGDAFAPRRRPRAGEDTYCFKRRCKRASRAAASGRRRQRTRGHPA